MTKLSDQWSVVGSPGGSCGNDCYTQTAYDFPFEIQIYSYDSEGHMLTDGDLTYTLDS